MDAVLVVARVVLAATFAAAAVGKLADREGSRLAAERFGVPPAVGVGLPLAELAIAVGLVIPATAAWAAAAAVLLLAVFCVAIARLLIRGEEADCHCFGSLGSARVGRGPLVRNAVLMAVSGFVAVAGWDDAGPGAFGWMTGVAAVAVVFGVVTVVHGAFSWQLFKQNGRLLERVEALESRAEAVPAPPFALPDLDGRIVSLDDLLAGGRGALLVFTDPECGACEPLLPVLGADHDPPLALISRGSPADNRAKAAEHGIAPVLLQDEFEVSQASGAFGLPAAVRVDPDGRVAGAPAMGAQDVAALLFGGER